MCETLALLQGDVKEESAYRSSDTGWLDSLKVAASGSLDAKTCFCEEGHCQIAEPIREQLLDLDLADEYPLTLWSGLKTGNLLASRFSGRRALPPDRLSAMRPPSRALLGSFVI